MITIDNLLYDDYSWKIARLFNRKYGLCNTDDDMLSEISMVAIKVAQSIDGGKVKFKWSDDDQVLKYFRISVKNRYCRITKKKIREERKIERFRRDREIDDDIRKRETMMNSICRGSMYEHIKYLLKKRSDAIEVAYQKYGIEGVRMCLIMGERND